MVVWRPGDDEGEVDSGGGMKFNLGVLLGVFKGGSWWKRERRFHSGGYPDQPALVIPDYKKSHNPKT